MGFDIRIKCFFVQKRKKGINFFIHLNNDDMFFWQWNGFEYMYIGEERRKVEEIIETIENFVKNNLKGN